MIIFTMWILGINDPTQMYMSYMSGSKIAPPGGVVHSTPIFSRSGPMPVKPFEPVSFNSSGEYMFLLLNWFDIKYRRVSKL